MRKYKEDIMIESSENWYSDETATLGDRIAAARGAAGLSQDDLAAKLGVRATTIDAWEHDRKEPRANRLQTLCGMLGVSLGWLLTGEGDGPEDLADPEATGADIRDLLLQMREVRSEIMRATTRLGTLEKKLRKVTAEL